MKKILHNFTLILSFSFCVCLSAQTINTIKVKKSQDKFYFYQKGNKKDTISKTEGDQFYLIVSDSLKKNLSIFIENGKLVKNSNDSLYFFKYIKGMRYESLFQQKESKLGTLPDYQYVNLVNGVSVQPVNTIIILFKLNKESKPFLENRFIYRE